jgi:hypothetical protein
MTNLETTCRVQIFQLAVGFYFYLSLFFLTTYIVSSEGKLYGSIFDKEPEGSLYYFSFSTRPSDRTRRESLIAEVQADYEQIRRLSGELIFWTGHTDLETNSIVHELGSQNLI